MVFAPISFCLLSRYMPSCRGTSTKSFLLLLLLMILDYWLLCSFRNFGTIFFIFNLCDDADCITRNSFKPDINLTDQKHFLLFGLDYRLVCTSIQTKEIVHSTYGSFLVMTLIRSITIIYSKQVFEMVFIPLILLQGCRWCIAYTRECKRFRRELMVRLCCPINPKHFRV